VNKAARFFFWLALWGMRSDIEKGRKYRVFLFLGSDWGCFRKAAMAVLKENKVRPQTMGWERWQLLAFLIAKGCKGEILIMDDPVKDLAVLSKLWMYCRHYRAVIHELLISLKAKPVLVREDHGAKYYVCK